jgi:hypothetical protein
MDDGRVESLVGRKRKRCENQTSRRVARRVGVDDIDLDDSKAFLELPTAPQMIDCYRAFFDATSNRAMAFVVCGVCARNVNVDQQRVRDYRIGSLPNGHRLIPRFHHSSHTLYEGMLLEPKGVKMRGCDVVVSVCGECVTSLGKTKENPPPYSLANNMWIGNIPWELQRLTFPEQLLVALIYPRVFVFKLFPKKGRRSHDVSTLQRGMRGNVSSYELNVDGMASMVQGKLMPRPPAILASVIAVTFIGLGQLPQKWLHSTFRVRRQVILDALVWLKKNNARYYGDIDIDNGRLECLPVDDVPPEILGIVRQTEDITLVDRESDGYVPGEGGEDNSEYFGNFCGVFLRN